MMKFKINDLVWVIASNFIRQGLVIKRSLFEQADGIEIISREEYMVDFGYDYEASFQKDELFSTLEELVNTKTLLYES